MKKFIIIVIIIIISSGCISTFQNIVIDDLKYQTAPKDPIIINNIQIYKNLIKFNVSYGGGCKEHCFSLYMSPAAFFESYPVQANLYLRHNSNGDACEALINEDISFNLRLVAVLYKMLYGNYDEIVINVFEYRSNDKLSDSYFPE